MGQQPWGNAALEFWFIRSEQQGSDFIENKQYWWPGRKEKCVKTGQPAQRQSLMLSPMSPN